MNVVGPLLLLDVLTEEMQTWAYTAGTEAMAEMRRYLQYASSMFQQHPTVLRASAAHFAHVPPADAPSRVLREIQETMASPWRPIGTMFEQLSAGLWERGLALYEGDGSFLHASPKNMRVVLMATLEAVMDGEERRRLLLLPSGQIASPRNRL